MSDLPDEYAPHPGSMLTPSNNYQPYDALANSHIPRPNLPTVPDDFGMAALELAGARSAEPEVKYEDSLMDEDFFEIQMKLLNEQFDGVPVILWDNNEIATRILQGHNRHEDSEFDQDLRENMLEIQMAVEQVRAGPLAHACPGLTDSELTIPQDFFQQQEQMLEAQYRQSQHELFDHGAEMEEIFNAQEALFNALESGPSHMEEAILDQPAGAMNPEAEPAPQSLEQIIEAEPMPDRGGMLEDMAGMTDYDDSLMSPGLLSNRYMRLQNK